MARDFTPVIPKEKLEHGAYYKGRCRNASIARWDSELEHFFHWRTKFGQTFLEIIKCPEDEKYWDVFVATEKIENPEIEIPIKESKESIQNA